MAAASEKQAKEKQAKKALKEIRALERWSEQMSDEQLSNRLFSFFKKFSAKPLSVEYTQKIKESPRIVLANTVATIEELQPVKNGKQGKSNRQMTSAAKAELAEKTKSEPSKTYATTTYISPEAKSGLYGLPAGVGFFTKV